MTEERRRRISDIIPKVVETGAEARAEAEPGGRVTRRYVLNAEVTFLQPQMTGFALDASETGMRVLVDAPLEVGMRCIAVVQLASGQTHERAEVIWAKRSSRGWEIGLKFAS